MHITLIEPFFTGSHAAWAKAYDQRSRHRLRLLTLSGHFWKWRMHGGAVTLANTFLASDHQPDLLLVSDMLDLTTFLALTRKRTAGIPVALYFHENQICYPSTPSGSAVQQKRDQQYGFINYTSALAADAVLFNSRYHQEAFLAGLPAFLRQFPDHRGLAQVVTIAEKSRLLPLGVDFTPFAQGGAQESIAVEQAQAPPLILWNHRWEYDKNPEEFFAALHAVAARGLDFRLAVLGESFRQTNPVFRQAKHQFADTIVHFGYAEDVQQYARWLHRADLLPVTSLHDFFGVSVVEALYCGCYPLLPHRLTYPELVSPEQYPALFYQTFEELVEKLSFCLENIHLVRAENFRHCIEPYSWEHMVGRYDRLLAELATGQAGG